MSEQDIRRLLCSTMPIPTQTSCRCCPRRVGCVELRPPVQHEFVRCRQWSDRTFPTLLLERHGETAPLAAGFATAEQVLSRRRQVIAA